MASYCLTASFPSFGLMYSISLNSLGPYDVMWHLRSELTSDQVIAYSLLSAKLVLKLMLPNLLSMGPLGRKVNEIICIYVYIYITILHHGLFQKQIGSKLGHFCMKSIILFVNPSSTKSSYNFKIT